MECGCPSPRAHAALRLSRAPCSWRRRAGRTSHRWRAYVPGNRTGRTRRHALWHRLRLSQCGPSQQVLLRSCLRASAMRTRRGQRTQLRPAPEGARRQTQRVGPRLRTSFSVLSLLKRLKHPSRWEGPACQPRPALKAANADFSAPQQGFAGLGVRKGFSVETRRGRSAPSSRSCYSTFKQGSVLNSYLSLSAPWYLSHYVMHFSEQILRLRGLVEDLRPPVVRRQRYRLLLTAEARLIQTNPFGLLPSWYVFP